MWYFLLFILTSVVLIHPASATININNSQMQFHNSDGGVINFSETTTLDAIQWGGDHLNTTINGSMVGFKATDNLTLGNLSYLNRQHTFNGTMNTGTMTVNATVQNPSSYYRLKIDGAVSQNNLVSSSQRAVTFTHSSWSTHEFLLEPLGLILTTNSATGVSTKAAEFNGQVSNVNANNMSGSTITAWFEYSGSPTSYIYKTSNQTITLSENGSFSTTVSGLPLLSNAKYYYRAAGYSNNVDVSRGDQISFSTLAIGQIPDYNFDKHFGNLSNASLDIMNMSSVASAPYTDMWGSVFWGFFFAMIFVMMWLRQEDITIPSLVGVLIGGSLWTLMPADWVSLSMSLTVVSLAGLAYSLIKGR